MADMVITPVKQARFQQYEFYLFSVIAFTAKSWLLIRLPYRPWIENTAYTSVLLLFIYCFFRFRQSIRIPVGVLACLAAAVGIDVLGNFFQLYNKPFGPLSDFDEFAHFFGSGFALIPVMWLLRATTRRIGILLPQGMHSFFSVTVAFSFCAWYEILELWDELFYGDFQRIWSLHDTANDLQYDLAGIVAFALAASLIYTLIDRRARQAEATA